MSRPLLTLGCKIWSQTHLIYMPFPILIGWLFYKPSIYHWISHNLFVCVFFFSNFISWSAKVKADCGLVQCWSWVSMHGFNWNRACYHSFLVILAFHSFFDEQKMGRGAINMAILSGRDHNSTLPVGFRALLGYRGTTVSHSFSTSRGTLVNFEYPSESIFKFEPWTSHSMHLIHHPRPLDHSLVILVDWQSRGFKSTTTANYPLSLQVKNIYTLYIIHYFLLFFLLHMLICTYPSQ